MAKSLSVFRFPSTYLRFAHSSPFFYSMTLPQDSTRTALDPASRVLSVKRLVSAGDLATYSSRRGTLLHKDVLTKVLSLLFRKLS